MAESMLLVLGRLFFYECSGFFMFKSGRIRSKNQASM